MWIRAEGPDGRWIVRKLLRRNEEPGYLRFLTFSCVHSLPLFRNDRIKAVFAQRLAEECERTETALVAWVIMPDHVHLLVLPPRTDEAITRFLHALKRLFARSVIARWRRMKAPILKRVTDQSGVSHFWQPGGGHDRLVDSDQEAANDIDYIHENPVSAGLVDLATDWHWSSARYYGGLEYHGPQIARIEL